MGRERLLEKNIRYPLGFTFSFPCKQEGLASARLTSWTKGFTCSGVVNEDVVKMLQRAIDEKVCFLHRKTSKLTSTQIVSLSTEY